MWIFQKKNGCSMTFEVLAKGYFSNIVLYGIDTMFSKDRYTKTGLFIVSFSFFIFSLRYSSWNGK